MNHQLSADTISTIFKKLTPQIEAGMSLIEIDNLIDMLITKAGAKSYNKGYKPHFAKVAYPAASCLSVNNVIAHGVPTNYKLKDGDIMSVDFGLVIDDTCADAAQMVWVGELSGKNRKLINAAKGALYAGIAKVKPGVKLFEIGQAIEKYAKEEGFEVNKQFCGHGIGKDMHEEPNIPHFRNYNRTWEAIYSIELKAGQVICLEPQIAKHCDRGIESEDGFSMITANGKNSAFWEHMILVTEDGHKVLTNHFGKEEI